MPLSLTEDSTLIPSESCSEFPSVVTTPIGFWGMEEIKAILFAIAFTVLIGYPYYRIQKWRTKPPPTNQEIRQSPEMYQARQATLKRDGYRCVWCKSTQNLEVDHIYPFAYFPELRFDIKNLRTLCRDCHKLTITYGYKAKTFTQTLKSK